MSQITDIINGHLKELTNQEEKLHDERIKICKQCPLYDENAFGKICSSKKYLNLKTGEVSRFPCPDCESGCGCRLDAKTRLISAHCPINKW